MLSWLPKNPLIIHQQISQWSPQGPFTHSSPESHITILSYPPFACIREHTLQHTHTQMYDFYEKCVYFSRPIHFRFLFFRDGANPWRSCLLSLSPCNDLISLLAMNRSESFPFCLACCITPTIALSTPFACFYSGTNAARTRR